MGDEYEMFRDVLRQIAGFDPDRALGAAAEQCLADMSPARQMAVVRLVNGSDYADKLLSRYGAIVVMEAA